MTVYLQLLVGAMIVELLAVIILLLLHWNDPREEEPAVPDFVPDWLGGGPTETRPGGRRPSGGPDLYDWNDERPSGDLEATRMPLPGDELAPGFMGRRRSQSYDPMRRGAFRHLRGHGPDGGRA